MKQPTAALCAILATLPLSALAQASPQTRSTDGAPPNASFASARVPNAAPQGAHTETPTANAETQIASAPPIADSGTRSTLRPISAATAATHDRRSQAIALGTPFERAQKAAQSGDFETAARLFDEARDSDETESDRLRAEIELAHALLALGLFDAATRRYDFVIRAGPNHPAYTEAIAGLLEVNALTGEDVLVGAILDREYGDAFARLTPAELDRVNTIVGVMSLRAGRLDEARAFFDSVSPTAVDGRRVDYLAGVLAARTGSPEVALALFERAIAPADASPTLPPDAPSAAFATSSALPLIVIPAIDSKSDTASSALLFKCLRSSVMRPRFTSGRPRNRTLPCKEPDSPKFKFPTFTLRSETYPDTLACTSVAVSCQGKRRGAKCAISSVEIALAVTSPSNLTLWIKSLYSDQLSPKRAKSAK